MRQALLKLIEENPALDCYSSEDLVDPIIQSRFVEIRKDPQIIDAHHNVEEFLEKYDACIQKKWVNLRFGDEVLFEERSGVYLGVHNDDAYLVYFKEESEPTYIDKHQLRITGMHFEPFKKE